MARPSKSVDAIKIDGKKHITQAEIDARKAAEKALTTGTTFHERAEVAKNEIAHAEFVRLDGLMSGMGKNDAIYETVINRYCIILAECLDFEVKREKISATAEKIEAKIDALDDEATVEDLKKISSSITGLYKSLIEIDRQIESKRKMLLSIEKENIMTVAAALRSVPKDPPKKENPLLKALSGDED